MQPNIIAIFKDWKASWDAKDMTKANKWATKANGDNMEIDILDSPSDSDIMGFGPTGFSSYPNLGVIIHDYGDVEMPDTQCSAEVLFHLDNEGTLWIKLELPSLEHLPQEKRALLPESILSLTKKWTRWESAMGIIDSYRDTLFG